MELFSDFFAWLYEVHNINLIVFYDPWERNLFFQGFLMTLKLSVVCLFFSVIIGIVGAWLQGSNLRLARNLMQGYIQFFRNTPPLVQMYFFYFVLGEMLPDVINADGFSEPLFSNFTWAVISLSFFVGAFNVEIFRAGIEAVPKSTVEAAEALGYNRLKCYLHVVLPLAIRISLPALNNSFVNLVKTTTLAFAIGVNELLYVSAQVWSEELNVPEMMNLLLVMYISIVGVLVWAMHRWERSMRIPGYGQ